MGVLSIKPTRAVYVNWTQLYQRRKLCHTLLNRYVGGVVH